MFVFFCVFFNVSFALIVVCLENIFWELLLLLLFCCYPDFPISDGEEGSIEHHSADKWLFAIAQGTMETYVKSILEIPKLNEEASQQLATDIGKSLYYNTLLCTCMYLGG